MKTLEDVIIKVIEGIIEGGWDVHREVFGVMAFFDDSSITIIMINLGKAWFTLSVLIPTGIHQEIGGNWWKTEEEAMDLAQSLMTDGYEDYSDIAQLILSTFKL